jgi:diguanylate cyclase (GGDEF)-like protein/PAS domain S-box-containing protein
MSYFFIGAISVSAFATIQFLMILGVIKPQGYIVPFFVGGIVGILLSIKQQKNNELLKIAQERQQILELVLEGTEVGLWDWDIETNKVIFNKQWCNLLGYNLSEIEPTLESLKKQIHTKELLQFCQNIKKYLDGKTKFYNNIYRVKHKNGNWIYILDKGKIIKNDTNGKPIHFVGTYTNITELKLIEEKLRSLAMLDELTGIKNRRAFNEYLCLQWTYWKFKKISFCILLIDIDYFKKYNDAYGHIKGDDCLKLIAQTIECSVENKSDMVARFGGEEFIVLLTNTNTNIDNSIKIGNLIRNNINKLTIPHNSSDCSKFVSVSIGIATTNQLKLEEDYTSLLILADKALYLAKNNGRNQVKAS